MNYNKAMKTIVLNGSPRKNQNTAMMLKSAEKGAQSAGAQTEYIDLYDLNYTGCRSCLACKRKGLAPCRCYWKDDLSPLLERIFEADALILGVPIYLGGITSQVHALMKLLHFCCLSYDDYSNYFKGKVNVGVIVTMNAGKMFYKTMYQSKVKADLRALNTLNGKMEIYPCCDTLQVNDYSKYNMASFSEEHKKQMRETQFPKDLEKAFEMGALLSGKEKERSTNIKLRL